MAISEPRPVRTQSGRGPTSSGRISSTVIPMLREAPSAHRSATPATFLTESHSAHFILRFDIAASIFGHSEYNPTVGFRKVNQ
jgi:hypothetical protein